MERHKGEIFLFFLSAFCCLSSLQAQDNNVTGKDNEKGSVTIKLGVLKITNRNLELRCEIRNDTEQDIWIYAYRGTNAEVFMDKDFQTPFILKRVNLLYDDKHWGHVYAPYVRLRAGQSRPEVFLVNLPIVHYDYAERRILQAIDRGFDTITRLAFEIGYYTTEDLNSLKGDLAAYQTIRFDESGDLVFIRDSTQGHVCNAERSARLTLDGVYIPFKQWLRSQTQSSKHIQALEDLFYNSSLGLEEYRYAQLLFNFDEDLFDDSARQIADAYIQVAKGKQAPSDLNQYLDRILSENDRQELIETLQDKQATYNMNKQAHIVNLLAEAERYDNQAQGRKALTFLEKVLAIDPSNDEAFNLMRKIGGYYQGRVMTNSIGMKLVWVPAGEFLMGSERNVFLSRPHTVRISRGFWMGVREVTQAQYEAIMGQNPSRVYKGDKMAVSRVSWHNAAEFCRRLSQREGRTYRLPTEAEWEYACRAGTSTDYWWGDDVTLADPNKANAFGLYDMHGNVGEWCQDCFFGYYYFFSPKLDPKGPKEASLEEKKRVVRNSGMISRFNRDKQCPSYKRNYLEQEQTHDHIGFRIVLDED